MDDAQTHDYTNHVLGKQKVEIAHVPGIKRHGLVEGAGAIEDTSDYFYVLRIERVDGLVE